MKLYTFLRDGREYAAVGASGGMLVDLAATARQNGVAEPEQFGDLQSIIDAGETGLDQVRKLLATAPAEALVAPDQVTIVAPLPRPRKIRGGSMYDRHLKQAAEGTARIMSAAHPDPEAALQAARQQFANVPGPGWYTEPAYYLMDATNTIGPDETVNWPAYSNWIDFELEVGAVVGRPIRDASAEEAQAGIMGYVLLNDLSARDAQLRAFATGMGAAGKGKEFDGGICLGPCIVTTDELPDPLALDMETRVNGQAVFRGHPTEAPQWTFGQILAFVSQGQTIAAGEIVTSGCLPSCCGIEHARKPDRGDTIELDGGPLGVIRTHIA